mmetsp:Transcript_26669/g.59261  ORF Transcript_26669/g.59261 Transcript_26669/m.59261 type:complete len:389 (-) Transcript_26669:174-1340(-)|eukprot:CAMPEP_0178508236 /NCGR_PEP_ID=MMETSP0696-20121128/20639_1 /TAXON_ID=265572 /ORGANISM="Extubocellulus spinifer, Strain CCMP396" /LENGTH=388 /DNA_ID=CAMNT_0020137765 /DNA_START=730 /DNA_END=1896 /DNA_ORIENTATION=-
MTEMGSIPVEFCATRDEGGTLFRCNLELSKYPALNDSDARKAYAAYSYLLTDVYQSAEYANHVDEDDEDMISMEDILSDLEEGFRCTKAGRELSPCGTEDGYEAIAHIVEDDGTLTVLVRCRDGYLRTQETTVKLPKTTAEGDPEVNCSSKFKRLYPSTAKLSDGFLSQLDSDVDAYFRCVVSGVKVPGSSSGTGADRARKLTKAHAGIGQKQNEKDSNCTTNTGAKNKRRSRNSPRLIRVLGHCPPKDYVTAEANIVVVYFQTDIGIGYLSAKAPRTGCCGHKCSIYTPIPVPVPQALMRPSPPTSRKCTPSIVDSSDVHGPDAGTAKAKAKAMAKSRIDNIMLLLSRMQDDSAFVDACCRLMGCADKNALMAISLDRLRLELENYH